MRRMPLLISLLLVLLALPATAHATDAVSAPVTQPMSLTTPPPGFTTNAREAMLIARSLPAVRRQVDGRADVSVVPFVWDNARWEIDFDRGARRLASVDVAADGTVLHTWTGLKAANYVARGDFDPLFAKPWICLTFALLFLVPFVDVRRLRRLLHLDLLVLSSFGVSYAFFQHAEPEAAVWLFYAPLAYFLVRLLAAGFRPRTARGRLVPHLPTAALVIGVVALFGARVALNVESTRMLDIGYASVVGADRIAHKQELYVDNEVHGDTYGPINYLAYVPFELAFPYKGVWDRVPAAHAAAIFFDLMTLLGLFLLGRAMRAGPEGRRLGLAMAWAWAAFPFTLLGLMDSTNDGLVAMLLVWMLVAWRSGTARGAMLGLATAAKFFPGAVLLLVARGADGAGGRRRWLQTVAACAGVFAFSVLMYLPKGGLKEFWDCTIGFQLHRDPDLSVWAMYDGIGWVKTLVEGAGLALAVAVAVLPGRRSPGQVAALAGAVTIAFQLPSAHWFYFYVVWFLPFLLLALFAEHRDVAAAAVAAPQDADAATDDGPPQLALAS